MVNDFHAERAESVAAEVEAAGVKALPLAFDVSDFEPLAQPLPKRREPLAR